MNTQDWLSDLISTYEDDLQSMGCLEVSGLPQPSLKNDIHPVFRLGRWMKGYGQHTEGFYQKMKPALKLASLMLTEECVLSWFNHLTFGHRRVGDMKDSSGRQFVYIEHSKEEDTGKARRETNDRLRDLGNVIVFMFVPAAYKKGENRTAWGATNSRRRDWEWSHEFRDRDYPGIPRRDLNLQKNGYRNLEVAMAASFQELFRNNFHGMTRSQRYRVEFMFAITLVHGKHCPMQIKIGTYSTNYTSSIRSSSCILYVSRKKLKSQFP